MNGIEQLEQGLNQFFGYSAKPVRKPRKHKLERVIVVNETDEVPVKKQRMHGGRYVWIATYKGVEFGTISLKYLASDMASETEHELGITSARLKSRKVPV